MSIECPTCAGCGKIANDDEGTPWKYWAELPSPSNLAVTLGIVVPLPCPVCGGTGKHSEEK
jgi:C4-type Zn-finger protein